MKRNWSLLLVLLVAAFGTAAQAKNVKYAGVHPRTGHPDGGLCYVESVHVHAFAPSKDSLYRSHKGVFLFVGDPIPFGYEGPKHRFYGHHPVTVKLIVADFDEDDVHYCYLDGPHWHSYEPPDDHEFVEKEEIHYFAGEYPEHYHQEKKRYSVVNVVYRPLRYERPVHVHAPPEEYVGPILGVNVNLTMPAVGVQIGIGSPGKTILYEDDHPHGHGKHKHKHKHKHGKHDDHD